jgi:hypothetical protein
MAIRNRVPSRAVLGGATVGTPLALLIGWAASRWNLGLPDDVLLAAASLLTAGTSWLFRGGRKGEAE